ncbi:MAG: carboxylesterase [Proteobacteria bacterium]|nr:carboxylesterase [Pseudomonadota bacterium]
MIHTLKAITVQPKNQVDACVIWLHGLGANGHDFENVIPSLGLPANHNIRFIFPHAPSRPVTLNAGFVMPAWYDIVALDSNAVQDEPGIRQSEKLLVNLIDEVTKEIASHRILLMGFSQGGALALHTALRFTQPLAGVGVLSGYLPLHDRLLNEYHSSNKAISIFMAHGLGDPIVPYVMGQKSYGWLESAGFKPTMHTYPMDHTVCLEELSDIGKWIQHRLGVL